MAQLDIVQLHQTDRAVLENPVFWNVIYDLKAKNWFRMFGISCYEKEEVDFVQNNLGGLLGAVQAPMNVLDGRMNPVAETCKAKHSLFIARSIFLKGVLTMPVEQLPQELEGLRRHKEILETASKKSGLSAAQIAVLSVAAREGVTTAILGIDSPAELLENCKTLEKMDQFKQAKYHLNFPVMRDTRLLDPRTWKSL